MEAEYYSDKSIAVYGDTKPWAANFKALGGRFNGSLRGGPGWIFQRAKEPELMQFLAEANAGQIQPTPQIVPIPSKQSALSPRAGLTIMTPFPQTTAQLPKFNPVVGVGAVNVPRPVSPLIPKPVSVLPVKPASVLPAKPATVNYPNLFTAADGLQYQIIMYTAPLPSVNQHITLTVGENSTEYVVTTIESVTPPFDSILITPVQVEDGREQEVSRAVLIKGEWKIAGLQDEHSITFH